MADEYSVADAEAFLKQQKVPDVYGLPELKAGNLRIQGPPVEGQYSQAEADKQAENYPEESYAHHVGLPDIEGPDTGMPVPTKPGMQFETSPQLGSVDEAEAFLASRKDQDTAAIRQRATSILSKYRTDPNFHLPPEWYDSLVREAAAGTTPTGQVVAAAKGIGEAFLPVPYSKEVLGARIPTPVPTWETAKATAGVIGSGLKTAAQFIGELGNPNVPRTVIRGAAAHGTASGMLGMDALVASAGHAVASQFQDPEERIQALKELWQQEHENAATVQNLDKIMGYTKGTAPATESAFEFGAAAAPFMVAPELGAVGKVIPNVAGKLVEDVIPGVVGGVGRVAPGALSVAGKVTMFGAQFVPGVGKAVKITKGLVGLLEKVAPEASNFGEAAVKTPVFKFGEFVKGLTEAPEGMTVFEPMQQGVKQEIVRLNKSFDLQAKAAGEKVDLNSVRSVEPNGKFTVDAEHLNPAEQKLRTIQQQLTDQRAKFNTLEQYSAIMKLGKDAAKLGVGTELTMGAGGVTMGGIAALQAMPEDVERSAMEGVPTGMALTTPALLPEAIKTMQVSRSGRIKAAGDYQAHKGSQIPTHPDAAPLSKDGQRAVNIVNGSIWEGGGQAVPVTREKMAELTGSTPETAPMGWYDGDGQKGQPMTAYLRQDAVEAYGQNGPVGHEFTHALDSLTGDTAKKAYGTILDGMKNPEVGFRLKDFLYNYMSAARRTDPTMKTLSLDSLMSEGAAELARYILAKTPLEELMSGKTYQKVISDKIGDAIAAVTGKSDEVFTAPGFGTPFTREQYRAMENAIYDWGKQVRRGDVTRPEVPGVTPEAPGAAPAAEVKIPPEVSKLNEKWGVSEDILKQAVQRATPNASPADIMVDAMKSAYEGVKASAAPAEPVEGKVPVNEWEAEADRKVKEFVAQGIPEEQAVYQAADAMVDWEKNRPPAGQGIEGKFMPDVERARREMPPRFYVFPRAGQHDAIVDRLTGKIVRTFEGPDPGEYSGELPYANSHEMADHMNEDSAPLPPNWTGSHPDAFIPELIRKRPDRTWGIEGPNNTIEGNFNTPDEANAALAEAHRNIYNPKEPPRIEDQKQPALMITEDPANKGRYQVINSQTGKVINYSLPLDVAEGIVSRSEPKMMPNVSGFHKLAKDAGYEFQGDLDGVLFWKNPDTGHEVTAEPWRGRENAIADFKDKLSGKYVPGQDVYKTSKAQAYGPQGERSRLKREGEEGGQFMPSIMSWLDKDGKVHDVDPRDGHAEAARKLFGMGEYESLQAGKARVVQQDNTLFVQAPTLEVKQYSELKNIAIENGLDSIRWDTGHGGRSTEIWSSGTGGQMMPEVNVGLHVNGVEKLTSKDVADALQATGVKVLKLSEQRKEGLEPTVVATLSRALTPKEGDAVSQALGQESIAQHQVGGQGDLFGPQAEKWGPFNPDYFVGHDGRPLTEALKDRLPTRTGASGIWDRMTVDPNFMQGEFEKAVETTGANPKERFYRQTPAAQKAIQDYFKSKNQAAYMPSPAGELKWTSRHFDMTPDQLEQFLIFGRSVAGHASKDRAPMIERALTDLLNTQGGTSPITALQKLNQTEDGIEAFVRKHGFGPYGENIRFLKHLAESRIPDLKTATEEELMNIPGIGPKTARFFKAHTDATRANNVMLDTHILRFLRETGYPDAPMSTPQDPKVYQKWSDAFRNAADEFGLSPSDLDLQIWLDRSGNMPTESYKGLEDIGAGRFMPNTHPDAIKEPAIRTPDGEVIHAPVGYHSLIPLTRDQKLQFNKLEMGFISNKHTPKNPDFMTRKQALARAKKHGQITAAAADPRGWTETGLDEALHAPDVKEGSTSVPWQYMPNPHPNAIKEAAIKLPDGEILNGFHHFDIDRDIPSIFVGDPRNVDGFLTNSGKFLTRDEAYQRALQFGQVDPKSDRPFRGEGLKVVSEEVQPPGTYMPDIQEQTNLARSIAEEAHKDQKRRFTGEPYFQHPEALANKVKDELKPAAYLHDVFEDTGLKVADLRAQGVPEDTIQLVRNLTRRPNEDYDHYIQRVKENPDARDIKVADLHHNLSTIPEDSTLRKRYVKAMDELVPSDEQVMNAIAASGYHDKIDKIGAHRDLPPGTPVSYRIDIPSYNKSGDYVVTVHKRNVGTVLGYDGIATLDNPTFYVREPAAQRVQQGAEKTPMAAMNGDFNPDRTFPKDIGDYTMVGFNPIKHSYFYEKGTNKPVIGGDKAISSGNTVFVKNPVYGNPAGFLYMPDMPTAIDRAALRNKETGEIITGGQNDTHFMIPASSGKADDYLGINGHKIYDEGFVDHNGNWYNRMQAQTQMKALGQLPPTYQGEYLDELNVTGLRQGRQAQFMPSPHPDAIKESAIRTPDGKIWTGPLHSDASDKMVRYYYKMGRADELNKWLADHNYESGFVNNKREYLNRQDALDQALKHKQIGEGHAQDMLAEQENLDVPAQDRGLEAYNLRDAKQGTYMPSTPEDVAPYQKEMKRLFPEAIPPTFEKDKQGNYKTQAIRNSDGLVMGHEFKPEERNWNFDQTPLYKQATKGIKDKAKADEAYVNALAQKIADEYHNSWKGDPMAMQAKGWYTELLKKISDKMGPENAELFAQLLSTTSPGNSAGINFRFALEAYNNYISGRYDNVLNQFKDAHAKFQAGELKDANGNPVDKQGKFNQYLRDNNILALQESGKKLGKYSLPAMYTLAGHFWARAAGKKVIQFVKNISGVDLNNPTIDLWAARTVDRLSHEGMTDKSWRDLPMNEGKVGDRDFDLAAAAYKKAAGMVGENATDLQAIAWFGEKLNYGRRGWIRGGPGAELGDFRPFLEAAHPKPGSLRELTIPTGVKLQRAPVMRIQ